MIRGHRLELTDQQGRLGLLLTAEVGAMGPSISMWTADGDPFLMITSFARADAPDGETQRGLMLDMENGGSMARIVLVPDTAVNTDQDKKYLFVIDDKDVVHRRDVRLGKLLPDGLRVIETNLQPTDRVIIEGTQRARIGYPVTPEEKDLTEEMKKLKGQAGE